MAMKEWRLIIVEEENKVVCIPISISAWKMFAIVEQESGYVADGGIASSHDTCWSNANTKLWESSRLKYDRLVVIDITSGCRLSATT